MMESRDPRHRNRIFEASSLGDYVRQYAVELERALASVAPSDLDRALKLIRATSKSGRRILVAGNGGSAAIADHLCCDFTKGTFNRARPPLRTQSLVGSISLYSAIANDFSFDEAFSTQIEMLAEGGDLAILISSSGKSRNIVRAAEQAQQMGVRTIGLTGFEGKPLRDIVDVSLHVEASNYGLIEDSHQAIMHCMAQYLDSNPEG